ncbi:MAG: Wzz/FepE/Etk N-terminal domain-containing protein [Solibacillus sp.]
MKESIDLRDIIKIFDQGKKTIIIFTIVTVVITFVLSWFVMDEKYESKAVVQLSSGVQDTGIMSNYVATEFTPQIYMKRIQNDSFMKQVFLDNSSTEFDLKSLKVENPVNSNLVELSYLGETAEDAQTGLSLIMNETKNQMNSSVKETLDQLEQTYLNESKSLSKEIETLMDKYNNIVNSNALPEVLILQTMSSSQFVINLTGEQNQALRKINGGLQNELLQLKAQIDVKSMEYSSVLAKYQSVKTGLDSFKPDPFVRVIIDPTLEEFPTSPNKIFNIAVGLVLGLMLGTALVFARFYWKEVMKSN